MKRVGYILTAVVVLLTLYTIALAQFEQRTAKYLCRVLTGRDEHGYFGSDIAPAVPYTGQERLFAVSATGDLRGQTLRGKVVFYDSTLRDEPALIIEAPAESELFGWAISGGGDWNGDGLPDLVVGAPCGEGMPTDSAGKAYLYFGGPEFGARPTARLTMGERCDAFGTDVDLSHDINGDNLADLVVGAPHSGKSGATSGRAYVWFGRPDALPGSVPDVEIRVGTTNDQLGSAIATGDVTGDGQADVVLGAPLRNVGDKMCGGVLIFRGGRDIRFDAPTVTLSGEATSFQDWFGKAIAIVPDVNGDGIREILVGAPEVKADYRSVGRAYLYHGGAPMSTRPTAVFTGTVEAGRFGHRVYSLDDVNGDGRGDWAVQAESEGAGRGVLRVYYGDTNRSFPVFTGESGSDRLGCALGVLDAGFAGNRHILVAARWSDADAEDAGRVYVLRIE